MTITRYAAAVSVLLAAAGTAGPRADEGSIPIFKQTNITTPGHYVVTRDFSFASGSGISISANNVTLDLNGHTITGPACSSGERVVGIVPSSANQGLVIRNGRLVGACDGIGAGSQSRISIRIEDIEVVGASGPGGIVIDAAEYAEILRCYIHDVTGHAISVRGFSGAYRGRISDNRIEHVGFNGMVIDGLTSGEISRNKIADLGLNGAGEDGIQVQGTSAAWGAGGNLIQGNSITASPGGTDDDGIRIYDTSQFNLVRDNVVKGCRIGLFVYGGGTRLERNLVTNNSLHGIEIGNGTLGSFIHLEENQVQGNTGGSSCGIKFLNGNGHVFRNNSLRNNTSGVCGGTTGTNTDGGGNIL